MTSDQLKIGSIISYLQMLLNTIIGLVYTPIMIRILGQSEYGLYNTALSTVSMLSILNLGFNSGYIRYFSKYKQNNDYDAISRLNGLFLIIFTIIGIIAAVCGFYFTTHLENIFKSGLTVYELQTAKVLIVLLTISLAISFPMSVFSNIISANERFIFLKLCGIFQTVISPLVTLPILLLGFGSISIVLTTILTSVFLYISYVYYVLFVIKSKFIFNNFEKGLFKSLFVYSGFIAINMVIDQVNWSIDKMLLARYKGTISVAIYSVGYTIYHHYAMFSTSISGVFTPRIHNLVNQTRYDIMRQKMVLTELFVKVGRIQYSVLALVCTGMVLFGKQFIILWAGKDYLESYYVAILMMSTASIALTQNIGLEIQRAMNNHQFRSIAYLIMALMNVVLSIYLCQIYGPVGCAIGTALSLIFANGLVMNLFYNLRCNIEIIVFWKNIIKLSQGLIIPIIIGVIINMIVSIESWSALIIVIVVYSIVYFISMWCFGFNYYEKQLLSELYEHIMVRFNFRRN